MMNWYKIPGFASYDINFYTKEVRSCKHYNTGFHIMKQSNTGAVTVVDDYGNRKYIKVDELYDITFNQGNTLEPRGEYDMYCGGMQRVNRRKPGQVKPGSYTLEFGPNGVTHKPVE